MEPAAKQLASDLKGVNFEELTVPLVANYHAKMITNSHDLKEALERQLESPVLWVDSILEMKSQGIDTFVEVGPGKILSSLVKRIIGGTKLYNVEDRASLDKTLSALGSDPS